MTETSENLNMICNRIENYRKAINNNKFLYWTSTLLVGRKIIVFLSLQRLFVILYCQS